MHHRGIVMQRARFVLGEGLLTSEEPLHMRQRRLVQPAFHRERIAAYGKTILQFAREMTQQWQNGATFNIHRSMLQLTLRIAGKCFFDSNVESEVQTISDAVTAFMGFLPLAFLPYPNLALKMPLPFIRRIRSSQVKLDTLIDSMIRERRGFGENGGQDRGDLLSMLLASLDVEGSTGGMTDRQVRDECLTLLLAGHETTANGLSFCFFLMAQNPEIQERVFTEAREAFDHPKSDGFVNPPNASEAYERLHYTRLVVAEALRLYPPVWVTARTATVSYNYRGVPISAGSLLLVPQIAIHRDPRFYPEPMRFDPTRFLPEAVAAPASLRLFPFRRRFPHVHRGKLCLDGGSTGPGQRDPRLASSLSSSGTRGISPQRPNLAASSQRRRCNRNPANAARLVSREVLPISTFWSSLAERRIYGETRQHNSSLPDSFPTRRSAGTERNRPPRGADRRSR